ncbi:dihydrolipoyl dehydrogenase family protein [Pengzhenrongella sicca]|uniref:NAD(P)/FAD-dependent oxidoreductase n=1 Tax=Pengzhenrongella sicca TaxID=2819238 RepID=A0A8A4ZLH3_9MICO|nr:NAD(P)/FAD-dependent oxidoreductase [Pengzhenrongella sicca]QTE30418.1 NAD(P)/FAD-dependent oxidoreductase [Pengzhenrongella sicca]
MTAADDLDTLRYDVVVLGAGAVGENVADRASRTGLSVVVVEAELVGGECSYWACMPSKALLRPGAVLAAAKAVRGAAGAVAGGVDVAATLARRDAIAHDWDDASQVEWLDGAGIDLVRGRARFTGPRTLAVTDDDGAVRTIVAARAVVVATGSGPMVPGVPGLAQAQPWTSREATAVQDVPESLAIIGGGVVGVEMATAFADFGARVTLLVRGDRVLSGAEPFASAAVADGLTELGVELRFGVEVTRAVRDDHGVTLTVDEGEPVVAAEVLVAAGRRPRTGDLGLEAIGLNPGDALAVDDTLRVTAVDGDWLYAAGDVTGRVATTHQGKYDARVVGDVIAARFGAAGAGDGPTGAATAADVDAAPDWSRFRASADHEAVPQVVFSRPEVASVGLTEAAARAAGYPVRVLHLSLASVAGASVSADDYAGAATLVVDTDRSVALGATFVGPEVAELLHAATIAVVGQVPLDRLWHAVPAYPTVSEVWLRLLEAYGL